jgi:hypothetical protein
VLVCLGALHNVMCSVGATGLAYLTPSLAQCLSQLHLPHALLCGLLEAAVMAGCAPSVHTPPAPAAGSGGMLVVLSSLGRHLREANCGPLHGHCPAALSGGWGWLAEAALVWVSVAAVAAAVHVMAARAPQGPALAIASGDPSRQAGQFGC